ncbi:hypothetical protein C1H46_030012 [Malus baccata]|uniref:Uncharacterized protein n=1 Tax=Malus baccata TaxID=106549 RepID=A0A540LDJ8_MALBA|nr:hypothetical protein C1H46_030012 [Malus baccata]
MIGLKLIQTSFIPTKHASLHTGRLSNAKNSVLRFSKSNDSDSESDASPPEGDTRKQELLVRIAMLQAQKEANAEFDKIGEDALKDLDEASDRILENINSRMQAFEESAGVNIEEMEKNKNELEAFEGSETRTNIYLALIGLLLVQLADSFITSTPDGRKVAFLGAIFVGLVSQVIYEQKMLSETESTEEGKTQEERR